MATNHNLSWGLSLLVGSYISLGNSGRPTRVTGRMGSPLPRKARGGTQAGARGRAEGSAGGGATGSQKPARDDACDNCGKLDHWAK
jgi:hypothetical protein